MERRLNRLEIIWSRTGERIVSPEETALTGQLAFALEYPSAVADADAADQLRFLHETIGRSRLPPGAVARCLIAALIRRGVTAEDAAAAVRVGGVEAVLAELAELGAAGAAWQEEARERHAAAAEAHYKAKKAAGRAAYFATHPRATDRDFEVGAWPKLHWQTDDPDELAALLAAAE